MRMRKYGCSVKAALGLMEEGFGPFACLKYQHNLVVTLAFKNPANLLVLLRLEQI